MNQNNKEWRWVKLSKKITIKKGKKVNFYKLIGNVKDGEIPLVVVDNLRSGKITEVTKDTNGIKVNKDDVIICWDGAYCGLVGTNLEGYLGSTLAKLTPSSDLNYQYLFLFLKINFEKLNKQNTGSAIPHLSKEVLLNLKIPLTSIEEQREIVARCEEVERQQKELMDINTADKAYINNLKQSILSKAIRGELVPQDPNDEPAQVLYERIQEERSQQIAQGKLKKPKPLPSIEPHEIPFDIPQSWKWVRLGSVLNKLTDGTHHSPKSYPSGEFKYITAKNIKQGILDLKNITYVTKELHDEIYSRCNPEIGDLLYIKDGSTTGLVAINSLVEEFSLLSSVALFKPSLGTLNKYLYFVLSSEFYYNQMRDIMKGSAITRVTLNKLEVSILPLPPLAEQQRIVQAVEQELSRISQLQDLNQQNTDLTQKLLTTYIKEQIF